jgi:CheY-like chemotaxis protein
VTYVHSTNLLKVRHDPSSLVDRAARQSTGLRSDDGDVAHWHCPRPRLCCRNGQSSWITAYGDADTRRKALEGGAEALLTKPIDFQALRSEIDTRIERAA